MSWLFAFESGENGPWLRCETTPFSTLQNAEKNSLAIWFMDTDSGSNNDRCMFSFGDKDVSGAGFRLGKAQSSATVAINREDATSTYEWADASNAYKPKLIDNRPIWNHAMTVVSGNLGVENQVWCNGRESGKDSLVNEHNLPTVTHLTIGAEGDSSPTDSWHGCLSHICMWHDYVLTLNDRQRLTRGEHPLSLTHILDKIVVWEPLDKPWVSDPNDIINPGQAVFTVGAFGTGADPVYDAREPPVYWPHNRMDDMSDVNSVIRTLSESSGKVSQSGGYWGAR